MVAASHPNTQQNQQEVLKLSSNGEKGCSTTPRKFDHPKTADDDQQQRGEKGKGSQCERPEGKEEEGGKYSSEMRQLSRSALASPTMMMMLHNTTKKPTSPVSIDVDTLEKKKKRKQKNDAAPSWLSTSACRMQTTVFLTLLVVMWFLIVASSRTAGSSYTVLDSGGSRPVLSPEEVSSASPQTNEERKKTTTQNNRVSRSNDARDSTVPLPPQDEGGTHQPTSIVTDVHPTASSFPPEEKSIQNPAVAVTEKEQKESNNASSSSSLVAAPENGGGGGLGTTTLQQQLDHRALLEDRFITVVQEELKSTRRSENTKNVGRTSGIGSGPPSSLNWTLDGVARSTPLTPQSCAASATSLTNNSSSASSLPLLLLPPTFTRCVGCFIHNFTALRLGEFASDTMFQPSMLPLYPLALCEFAALTSRLCNFGCDPDTAWGSSSSKPGTSTVTAVPETFPQCIARVGLVEMEAALPTRCTETPIFRRIKAELANMSADVGSKRVEPLAPRSFVFASETTVPSKVVENAKEWPAHNFGPPKICTNRRNETVYPISFAIPRQMVAERVSRDKLFDFLPYVPITFSKIATTPYPFRLDDEALARELHHRSYYAFTHRRGGWDCLRHYEILAAGCVPYFVDLIESPVHSLTSLPRHTLYKALQLNGVGSHVGFIHRRVATGKKQNLVTEFVRRMRTGNKRGRIDMTFKKPGKIDWSSFNATAYMELAETLLEYTKKYLTTRSLAAYVIDTMERERQMQLANKSESSERRVVKRVLLIGPDKFDYAHTSLEHGLGDLGIDTTVVGGAGPAAFHTARCKEGPNDPLRVPRQLIAELPPFPTSPDEHPSVKKQPTPAMQKLINGWKQYQTERAATLSNATDLTDLPHQNVSWCVWSEEDMAAVRHFGSKVAPQGWIQGMGWDLGFRGDPRYVKQLQLLGSQVQSRKRGYGAAVLTTRVEQAIKNHEFDIIVYVFPPHAEVPNAKDRPFFPLVEQHYAKHEIAFIDGYDIRDLSTKMDHEQRSLDHALKGVYFRREIPDASLCDLPL